MTNLYLSTIRAIVSRFPAVIPHLTGKARWAALSTGRAADYKTYDYFLHELERMIRNVYNGNLGGEFIDIMENLIIGQLTQAFEQAWEDAGDGTEFPDYLQSPLEEMILGQYDHVDGLYRDIIDARVDGTPLEPLLARAPLWANQWNTAYELALSLILQQQGGNQIWVLGETEKHCTTCAALNGIVMSAREWAELDVHPQGAPNGILECGGWNCDCSLEPTQQRRSPDAYTTVLNIVSR